MAVRSALYRLFGLEVEILVLTVVCASVAFLGVIGIGPHTGRYRVATVLSGSMRPTFPPGSVVFSTPVDARSVRVGDVLMFRAGVPGNPVVTHRVIATTTAGPGMVIRTKGDANPAPDPWTTRVDGRVWRVRMNIEGVGLVIQALRERGTQHLLGRVVPVLLALAWIAVIWRPVSEEA